MTHILLPTDFSEFSHNAIKYALEMYGKTQKKANFTLFHVHQIAAPMPAVGSVPVSAEPRLLEASKKRLIKECAEWQHKYPKLTINDYFTSGDVANEIHAYVKDHPTDLVVVASHKKSGLDRWIEGLNAYDIAKEAGCSVLVIPDTVIYNPLKKIVFATDFRNLGDFHILDPLREIVKQSETRFLMLHIYSEKKTSPHDRYMMNSILNDYFDSRQYNYYFLEHNDPAEGIEEFVQGYRADMLALVSQERGFFDKLFHKSVTKQMIIHSELPLLILHE